MGEQLCLVWPVNNAMEPGDDEEQVSSLRSSPSEHTLSWHTPCPELGSADAILRVKVSPTSPAFQHTSRRIWYLVAATLRCPSGISAARRGGRGGGPLLSHHTTPHHTTPHHTTPLASRQRPLKTIPPCLSLPPPPWTFPNRLLRRCAASPCDLRGDGALMLMQLLSIERNSSSDNGALSELLRK